MALPQPEPVNFSREETIAQLRLGPSASKEADDCLMARAADLLSPSAQEDDAAAEGERVELHRLMDVTWAGFTDALPKMRAAMESHPFWRKAVGTPLENDLPVRAAEVATGMLRDAALSTPPSVVELLETLRDVSGALEKHISSGLRVPGTRADYDDLMAPVLRARSVIARHSAGVGKP
jgi:hypothetical protein